MENLININYETEQPTISARDLHKALEISSRFSRWFDTNKELFVEGEDYNKCTSSTVVNNGAVRELTDYEISVLMAKHLSLMSRTEKGKRIRQYLIDLEKAWNTPEQVMARALKMADVAINKLKNENIFLQNKITEKEAVIEKQDKQLEIQKPFVQTAIKLQNTNNTVSFEQAAKLESDNNINIGRNTLMKELRNHGILMENNSPYEKYKKAGLFVVKMTIKENHYGTKMIPVTRVTGKGLIFIDKKLKEWFGVEDSLDNIDLDKIFGGEDKYAWIDNM